MYLTTATNGSCIHKRSGLRSFDKGFALFLRSHRSLWNCLPKEVRGNEQAQDECKQTARTRHTEPRPRTCVHNQLINRGVYTAHQHCGRFATWLNTYSAVPCWFRTRHSRALLMRAGTAYFESICPANTDGLITRPRSRSR